VHKLSRTIYYPCKSCGISYVSAEQTPRAQLPDPFLVGPGSYRAWPHFIRASSFSLPSVSSVDPIPIWSATRGGRQ
jgi:hypothetical protein